MRVLLRRGDARLHARGVDWGFTTFMPLKDVLDPKRGFLKDDTLVVPLASGHCWQSCLTACVTLGLAAALSLH